MIKIEVAPTKKITGSRIAGVMGRSEFKSKFEVWAEIMGLWKEDVDNVFVDFGNKFESKAIKWAEKKLGTLEVPNKKKIQYDYYKGSSLIGGIPDGFTEARNVVEVKLTHERNRFDWEKNDAAYRQYLYQTYLYQMMENSTKGISVESFFFVVGFYNDEELNEMKWRAKNANMMIIEVEFDHEFAQSIMQECINFWTEHVETGIAPELEISGKKADKDKKIATHLTEFLENRAVQLTPEEAEQVKEYMKIKETFDTVKKKKEAGEKIVKSLIAGREAAIGVTGISLTNSIYSQETFDKKSLKEKYPEIYDEFVGSTMRSRMNLKRV